MGQAVKWTAFVCSESRLVKWLGLLDLSTRELQTNIRLTKTEALTQSLYLCLYRCLTVSGLLRSLTHSCFRGYPEIVVWIFDTFDNNFEIKDDFTRYFKESCG